MAEAKRSLRAGANERLPAPPLLHGYLGIVAALTVAYYVFPHHHLQVWTPLGLTSVAALLIGIRVRKPPMTVGWYFLAAATFCFITGDTIWNFLVEVLGQDNPFPSVADVFYLLTYPLFAVGLMVLIRGRTTTRDRGSLLDAAIITTAVGLVVWVYVVLPNFHADLSAWARTVSIPYPLGDVLVLAMFARLVTGGGLRFRSTQLLALGAVGLLASDIVYGMQQLESAWLMGGFFDLGWICFYVAWGAAALHPSMRHVTDSVDVGSSEMHPGRMAVLGGMGLIAPAVLLTDMVANDGRNAATVGVFAACLYVLVVARMLGIVSVHKQSVARERVLRVSGESLVSASDVNGICAAALTAVTSLTRGERSVQAAVYLLGADGPERVASSPLGTCIGSIESLWRVAVSGTYASGDLLSVSALRYDHALRGMLAVRSDLALTHDIHGALTTLATQVSLALESNRFELDLRQRQSEAHFSNLVHNASDVIVVVAPDGQLTYGRESLQRALGLDVLPPRDELRGLVHPDDATTAADFISTVASRTAEEEFVGDWRLKHADGQYHAFEVVSRNLSADPAVGGVVFTMRDVSERRTLEDQLTHQAYHDGLTGLANRALFQQRASRALQRTSFGSSVAMIMVDLDDFKEINDVHGHGVGDQALLAVASRLRGVMRPGDTASRLGGDEFAVLLEDVPDARTAGAVASRVLESFNAPVIVNDLILSVHASAGLVLITRTDGSVELTELLLRADLALYEAKASGKAQFRRYEPRMRDVMVDRLTRRTELKSALQNEELFLEYQPIVQIETGEVVGVEALVRWQHPQRGVIPPNEFIALAEETGLIVELGRWVLDTACAQAHAWAQMPFNGVRMSVNVSSRQLQEATFVDEVRDCLQRHEIPSGSLILELTESVLLHEGSAIQGRLTALKDLGVKIAIDDFGTGYSGLGYLQHFAIDVLKVDKSFIDGLGQGSSDAGALASVVVSLAHQLRLEIVAEGIERSEQRDELWSLGCGMGQGYFYAKSLSADALTSLLAGSGHLGGPSIVATHGELARLRTPPPTPVYAAHWQ